MFSRNLQQYSAYFLVMLVMLFVSACQTVSVKPTPTVDNQVTPTAGPTRQVLEPTPLPGVRTGLPLPVQRSNYFATSGVCSACHTGLVDEGGRDVSNDELWRSTMMANSSRDPYWKASVRAEVLQFPNSAQAIEDKCATCHLPMAWFLAYQADEPVEVFGESFLTSSHKYHLFAVDGVSCTLCHQVEDENLGHVDSFSGGFSLDEETKIGERVAYGPYHIPRGQANIMLAGSGFMPLYAGHTGQSELCATCHNLTTDTLDPSGLAIGEFHEQMAYMEWQHSAYSGTHSCQDCHMPPAEGAVRISNTGSPPRSPFMQHYFVGGNAYMLELIDKYGDELGVTASSEHFQATQARTLDQLENRTASIEFERLEVQEGELVVDIQLYNQAGHKFPSGYPSRRAWLYLQVQDANGDLLFESGKVNPDGSIQGNDNDLDKYQFEPHYQVINSPDKVQIYEVVFVDSGGSITTGLLSAFEYIKDNRLIPEGFEKLTASPEIAVYGGALNDSDFTGGRDRLSYRVEVGNSPGPFSVTVQLLYQSIAYRWMENLRSYQAPEIEAMASYYDSLPNLPVIVGELSQEVRR